MGGLRKCAAFREPCVRALLARKPSSLSAFLPVSSAGSPLPWRRQPGALLESVLQVDRNAVLLQQIGKGLIGELLECRHPVARQLLELGGGVVVEGDQLAYAFPACRPVSP